MLAVLSQCERDLVVERTTMALQHKRSRGQRVLASYLASLTDSGQVQ
jgi:DNA invertase Pin-like site-specific DNA recombinase